jgi:hypothetical protein
MAPRASKEAEAEAEAEDSDAEHLDVERCLHLFPLAVHMPLPTPNS